MRPDFREFKGNGVRILLGSSLQHSAKGSTWEEHKYVKNEGEGENKKYYYPDDYKGGRHLEKGGKKNIRGWYDPNTDKPTNAKSNSEKKTSTTWTTKDSATMKVRERINKMLSNAKNDEVKSSITGLLKTISQDKNGLNTFYKSLDRESDDSLDNLTDADAKKVIKYLDSVYNKPKIDGAVSKNPAKLEGAVSKNPAKLDGAVSKNPAVRESDNSKLKGSDAGKDASTIQKKLISAIKKNKEFDIESVKSSKQNGDTLRDLYYRMTGRDPGKLSDKDAKAIYKEIVKQFDTDIKTKTLSKDEINDLATRGIRGEFGNGQARKDALGKNYQVVQDRINEILRGSVSSQKVSTVSVSSSTASKVNAAVNSVANQTVSTTKKKSMYSFSRTKLTKY